MFKYKMRFIKVLAVILLLSTGRSSLVARDSWFVARGSPQDARLRIHDSLTTIHEEIAALGALRGPDLDAFIEAEMLFCEGKFDKAVRSFDKFLAQYPESKLYEVALDRQFVIATAFLAGQKKPILKVFKINRYAEGIRTMERISDRAGDAPIGVKAALAIAKSYERREKFNEAYHQWSQISSRWPTGQIARDALLAMGRCKHAGYKGPKYDDSDLISAKSYYEIFKLRYLEDAREFDIDERLEQINEQLAYKQFIIGRYYQENGNKLSANLYYQMVIDNWPKSTVAKMAKTTMEDRKSSGKKGKKWKKDTIKKLEKLFL